MSGSYCMARILVEALLGGGIPHGQPCTANQQPLPICTLHTAQQHAQQGKLRCYASYDAMQATIQCMPECNASKHVVQASQHTAHIH